MTPAYVTGIGSILPDAIGIEALQSRLREGRAVLAPLERFDTSRWKSHLGGVLRDFRPRDFIPVMKMRRMNELSRMAMASTRIAIDAAKVESTTWKRGEVGVAIGTMFGPVRTSVEYMDAYLTHGPALAPPQLFAESVANAPGSHIAIEYGFEGFNLTFTQRESSFMAALVHAVIQLRRGRVAAAVVGGVDELNEVSYEVLARAGALARDEGSGEAMRPFDRRRNGLVPSEGAVSLIVEAQPRNGALAAVRGIGIARDATAPISDWGSDHEAIVRAARRSMADADVSGGEIAAVYASANGSRRGDRVERLALEALFGDDVPPVTAVKGVFGEYAAGSALPLTAACLALSSGEVHPTAGFELPEEGAKFSPVRSPSPLKGGHILVLSVSAGGGIVAAVLSHPDHE